MLLKTHIIHPGSSILDLDVEVKHFKWDWNPTQLFPNFNTKAFNSIMNSLRESSSMSIEYINQKVSLRINSDIESQDSAKDLLKNEKEESHMHPNVLLYLFFILLIFGLIGASDFIVKN